MGRAVAQRGAGVVATTNEIAAAFGATPEVYAVVKSQIAPPNTPDEVVALYFARCKQTGSDPMGRMLYIINRPNKGVDNWRIEATIDFFRAQAEATGEYAGQKGPYWCGDDGQWTDVWLKSTPPSAAKVGILRRGFDEPLWAVARFSAYYGAGSPNYLKTTLGEVLIAKVAEMLGFRKAFPQRLNGIYGAEEMEQANNERTVVHASVTPDGSVAVPPPQEQVALPPAHDEKPQEKRTLADISRLFAELQAEGETRPKVAYLTQNESRWLKPGARGVQERARNHAVTFSDAEIAAICTAIEDDLVQRRTFVQEAEVVTPGADDTEHEPECTCPDDGDEYHKPGCPADDVHTAPYPAELPLDGAMIAAPATGEHGPSQGQLDAIHAELTRLFGRSETKKTAWLKANGGWDAPSEIEFADHAQVVLDHLKGMTRA